MIDLSLFCSSDENRKYLWSPSSSGAFTYATNGHIAVRVDRRSDVPENPDYPDVQGRIFDKVDFDQPFAPVPTVRLPKLKRQTCDRCEGLGLAEHECPCCKCKCRTCGGEGFLMLDEMGCVEIDGFIIDLKYFRMIAALDGAQFPVGMNKGKPAGVPMPFLFDGGKGIIMGMRATGGKLIVASMQKQGRAAK